MYVYWIRDGDKHVRYCEILPEVGNATVYVSMQHTYQQKHPHTIDSDSI